MKIQMQYHMMRSEFLSLILFLEYFGCLMILEQFHAAKKFVS